MVEICNLLNELFTDVINFIKILVVLKYSFKRSYSKISFESSNIFCFFVYLTNL